MILDGHSLDDDDFMVLAKDPAAPEEFPWSREQRAALNAIEQWLGGDSMLFRLFGYAGCGKTTLVKEVARRLGGNVVYCAFSGKAALVMRGMDCEGAQTIHSLIYLPLDELIQQAKAINYWLEDPEREAIMMDRMSGSEDKARRLAAHAEERKQEAMRKWGTCERWELIAKLRELRRKIADGPKWELRDELNRLDGRGGKPDCIVVDECSMVGELVARDLMSFDIPVIAIGDPFQLPPPKDAGYFTNAEPDAMLKQVFRQKDGNPIIDMATTVRQDGLWALKPGIYGDSKYILDASGDALTEMLLEADQVLCGRNATRHRYNTMIREALGFGDGMPQPGERIVCRMNRNKIGLLNGGHWIVNKCEPRGPKTLRMDITSFDDPTVKHEGLAMHAAPFMGGVINEEDKRDHNLFEFGYVITVHVSQGSQWRKVAMIEDGWRDPETPQSRERWFYTGIKRAQNSVAIIKPKSSVSAAVRMRSMKKSARLAKLGSRRLKDRGKKVS